MIIIIINSIYDYYYHCLKQIWKQLNILIIIIINVENSWKYLLLLSSMLKTVFLLILGWNMTFVFKWACSSKSYIITKIRKHFFKANVYYFWITKLHMQTSDLRFKMLSNAAFKTVKPQWLSKPQLFGKSQHIFTKPFIDGKHVYSSVFGNPHMMIMRI